MTALHCQGIEASLFSGCCAELNFALQIKKGEAFVSETDTEVIPKLCNYIYNSSQEKVAFHEVRIEPQL